MTKVALSTYIRRPVDLSGDTAGTHFPSLIALDNGRTAAVWTQEGSEGIFLAFLDAAGALEGPPIRVTSQDERGNRPSVALLENGDLVVTYTGLISNSTGAEIRAQVFTQQGVPVGPQQVVFEYTDHLAVSPETVAMLDGGFLTVFSSLGLDGSLFGVFARLSDATGAPVGPALQVNQTTNGSQSLGEAIVLADGGFAVTWNSSNVDFSFDAVMLRLYDADGTPRSNEMRVNQFTFGTQRNSDITKLSDGRFVITWQSNGQDGSDYGVYGRIYNSDGTPKSSEFRINTTTALSQNNSSVAATEDGGFVVAWTHEASPGRFELRSQIFDAEGEEAGPETVMTSGPEPISDAASIFTGSDGIMRAVWVNWEGGNFPLPPLNVFSGLVGIKADGTSAGDNIGGTATADLLHGNSGADTIEGANGDDSITGGAGADSINGGAGDDTLEGGSAFDMLNGGVDDDSMVGGTGADTVNGNGGNDTLYANTGRDLLNGGAGDDFISAGDGDDTVFGNPGDDTVLGRSGRDKINGGTGDDLLTGAQGIDTLNGQEGNDDLRGGTGWDILLGGAGDDTIQGNQGADSFDGGAGADLLLGATGDDTIRGGAGNDTIQGNQGVDLIEGGAGNDNLRGGTLMDTFIFSAGDGHDTISDFEVFQDRIEVSSDLVGTATTGAEVIVLFGGSTGVATVLDFGTASVTFTNFLNLSDIEDNIFVI